ncbi:MAG: endonuclease/exonuclease/phosphatase family protein [Casimicrobium sp.]
MKIITWNVQWFCGLDGVIDIARVVKDARDMADFDVICMQEVAVNYPRLDGDASHNQPAILKSLLPGFEVFFGAAVDELGPDGKSRQRFGNLIATRLPVVQVQHHALPYPADTTPGGVRSMPRMCTNATITTPFGPVRFMTTHLEFYSPPMRMAQAQAILRLHREACAHAATPPLIDDSGSAFQSKPHTPHCILTGDFNFEIDSPEYTLLNEPEGGTNTLHDAWTFARPEAPHTPTFRLHDRRYGPEPIACDFMFVSETLVPHVKRMEVNLDTRFSDHQPVMLELG